MAVEAIHAFEEVNRQYSNSEELMGDLLGLSQPLLYGMTAAYLSAGGKYFANTGYDEYLRRLGIDSGIAARQIQLNTAIVSSLREGLPAYGIPILRPGPAENRPLFIFWGGENSSVQNPLLFIPHEVIFQFRINPIEGLASILYVSSHLRDLSQEQTQTAADMEVRSAAAQAHFLKEALKRHANISLSPYSLQLLVDFPNGIMSLSASLRYWEG